MLAKDKLLHFVVGVVAAIILLVLSEADLSPAWTTFVGVCILGLAKEGQDHFMGTGKPEFMDAVATIAGGAAVIGIALLLGLA